MQGTPSPESFLHQPDRSAPRFPYRLDRESQAAAAVRLQEAIRVRDERRAAALTAEDQGGPQGPRREGPQEVPGPLQEASLDLLEAKSQNGGSRRPCGGGWMRSEVTGRIVPKTCKSWLCPTCNVFLRAGAVKMLMSGMLERPEGHDVALLTFTEPSQATLDLPGFLKRHQKTIQRLQNHYGIPGYCTAVEFQKRGALHPHIAVYWPHELSHLLPDQGQDKRSRDQYRFHFRELVPMAQDLGWGKVCDGRAAVVREDLARYAVKQLAGYATKEAYRKFKEAGAQRIRPLRSSRSWSDKRLRQWQRGEKADPGPWVDVTNVDGYWGRG